MKIISILKGRFKRDVFTKHQALVEPVQVHHELQGQLGLQGELQPLQQQQAVADMSHSQMLGKVEYGGGPIFKVVLEC